MWEVKNRSGLWRVVDSSNPEKVWYSNKTVTHDEAQYVADALNMKAHSDAHSAPNRVE